jgi:hypothetical protein
MMKRLGLRRFGAPGAIASELQQTYRAPVTTGNLEPRDMWRLASLAYITLAWTTTGYAAQICDRRGSYHLSHDGNYPMFIRTHAGTSCEATFSNRAGSDLTFKRLFLVTPPVHGKINLREGGYYIYSAPSGYRGADTFTLKLCGTESNKPGCATLNYSVTID